MINLSGSDRENQNELPSVEGVMTFETQKRRP